MQTVFGAPMGADHLADGVGLNLARLPTIRHLLDIRQKNRRLRQGYEIAVVLHQRNPLEREAEDFDRFSTSAVCHCVHHPIALGDDALAECGGLAAPPTFCNEIDGVLPIPSASSAMIRDTSTLNKEPCRPSTTRSARGCHPCLRYVPSPMSPGCTLDKW